MQTELNGPLRIAAGPTAGSDFRGKESLERGIIAKCVNLSAVWEGADGKG